MKKLIMILLAIVIALPAFAAPTSYMPNSRYTVPDGSGMEYLGNRKVTQKMQSGGTITMRGYQKGDVQLVTMTFKNEDRPYCWWYSDMKGSSVGRCDINNDGKYEYDFGGEGRTGHKLYFKKYWPTAYE